MAKDVMAESAALLGDVSESEVAAYKAVETPASAKLLQDVDTTEITTETARPMVGIATNGTGDPDYAELEKRLSKGEELWAVQNTLKRTIVLPWDIPLMPLDLVTELKKYLSEKYIMYGQQKLINTGALVVSLFVEGRTVNFLESFMVEKQVPSLVSVQEGKETFVRSRFVIRANETVICTREQLKSLEKFEKVKHVTSEGKESSVLGFLYFDQIMTAKELRKHSRSFVTLGDVVRGGVVVGAEEMMQKTVRNRGNYVRA